MNILTPSQVRERKSSDTIVIYGSGSSISRLTKEDIMKLAQFDSVGFN